MTSTGRARPFARAASLLATSLLALGLSVGGASAQNGPVTFADIYAAPDDADLNLAYARQQMEAGELLDAASALERMLFANRDWDSARLLYALTLLRLDDRAGAAREAQLLANRPLSASDSALLGRINARLSGGDNAVSTGEDWSGRIALAGRYDDNAGGVFGDIVFGGNDQPDESVQLQAVVQFTTPLGGSGTSAYMRGFTTQRVHEDVSDSDLAAVGFAAGVRGSSGRMDWTLGANVNFIDIARRSYLDQVGLNARLGFELQDTLSLGVEGSWHDQDYRDTPRGPTASRRSGDLISVGPYFDWQPAPSLRLTGALAYQDKSAERDALAYDGLRASLRGRYGISDNVYLSARGEYRTLDYKADNFFVFPAGPREDEYWRARASIGISAAAITGNRDLRPVSIEAAVNHSSRTTNIPGRGFDNSGGEIRLIFDF